MLRLILFVALFNFTFAEKKHSFGEIENIFAIPNEPFAPAGGLSCSPSEYRFFNGYCYSLVLARGSGDFGEEMCKIDGGHLASIHSLEENEFIANLGFLSGGAWIGLKKDPDHFLWSWTDESDNDFKHWTDNPTNEGKPADYAKIEESGFWNYEAPKTELFYICKKQAI